MIKIENDNIETNGDLIDVISELGCLNGAFLNKIYKDTESEVFKELVLFTIIQGTILGGVSDNQRDKVLRSNKDFDKITYEIRNALKLAIEWGEKL